MIGLLQIIYKKTNTFLNKLRKMMFFIGVLQTCGMNDCV